MSAFGIGLVLFSALLHASWNFFTKGSKDRWAFYIGQSFLMLVGYTPVALWHWPVAGIDFLGWLCILGSAAVHAAYAWFLLKSYDAGDLSVAYPLSRTAPILVAGWDVLTNGQVTLLGVLGALLAGAGALILQLPSLSRLGLRAVSAHPVTRYALMTSVCIAMYTVIDKQGVVRVPALLFLYLLTLGEVSVVCVGIGTSSFRRVRLEMRRNAGPLLATAVISPLSYLLILWVLATAPASYVLALRQTSIVFGVLLGALLLGEGQAHYRLAGAVTISLGGMFVAVAG